MIDEVRSTPNSHLGDVYWSNCVFWGNLEFLYQSMLGMSPEPPDSREEKFLAALERPGDLWDWFHEIKLKDGRVAYLADISDMGSTWVCQIETHYMYGDEITDEDFQRLIKDFVAYARTRPIVNQGDREGAGITDEEIAAIYASDSPEEQAFWASLPTVVKEAHGLPHYLWLESLEHQQPEPD